MLVAQLWRPDLFSDSANSYEQSHIFSACSVTSTISLLWVALHASQQVRITATDRFRGSSCVTTCCDRHHHSVPHLNEIRLCVPYLGIPLRMQPTRKQPTQSMEARQAKSFDCGVRASAAACCVNSQHANMRQRALPKYSMSACRSMGQRRYQSLGHELRLQCVRVGGRWQRGKPSEPQRLHHQSTSCATSRSSSVRQREADGP